MSPAPGWLVELGGRPLNEAGVGAPHPSPEARAGTAWRCMQGVSVGTTQTPCAVCTRGAPPGGRDAPFLSQSWWGAPPGGRDIPFLSQSLPHPTPNTRTHVMLPSSVRAAPPTPNTRTHEIPISECLPLVIQGTFSEHLLCAGQ